MLVDESWKGKEGKGKGKGTSLSSSRFLRHSMMNWLSLVEISSVEDMVWVVSISL